MKLINSARFTAVIDANVLFPIVVRDYLLWLSVYDLYSPKWSSKLQEEFSAIFDKKKLGISAEKIESQVRMMNKACPDALVMKYESLIESIKLPDENDRHIVAAAIKCNANVIVTYNLKDFPNEYLKSIGLFAVDPDSFIADMIDLSPEKCCDAFREMVLSKKKPPYDEPQYLEVLKRNGLIQTAEELVKYF
jgi:predicted nucleic acid-binding protein